MITSPESNVQLTFEQLQQIDTAQKRLLIIQNEVNAASKILSETRNDTDRMTREKEYQQGLLDIVTAQVMVKQAEKIELDEQLVSLNAERSKIQQFSQAVSHETEQKSEQLKSWEESLVKREVEYVQKNQTLSVSINDHHTEKIELENKKKKLQTLIETI